MNLASLLLIGHKLLVYLALGLESPTPHQSLIGYKLLLQFTAKSGDPGNYCHIITKSCWSVFNENVSTQFPSSIITQLNLLPALAAVSI